MKKLIFLISFLLFIPIVSAGSFSATASNLSPTVGSTVKVTVKASGALGKFSVSSSNSNVLSGGGSSWIENSSYSFSFTAKSVGKAVVTISAVDVSDSTTGETISGSKTITINVKEKAKEVPKSSINYLSSLSIEGAELSPAFDKNTMDYEVTLEADVTKIKIEGTKESSVSSVTGLGEFDVSEGLNNLQVIVTAENGAVRTYNIKATVLEQSPIIVNVDGEEKTLVRKSEFLPSVSDYYVLDSIEIEESSIPAYYNETINYYLVGLKDINGNISLYRYNKDDNTYSKYNSSSFSSVNFVFLKSDSIPKGYKEDKIVINDAEVTCYTKKDELPLVYGINLEDGNTDFYSYDSSQNTIQRYVFSKDNTASLKTCLIVLLGVLCLIEFFAIIKILLSKNKKMRKNIQDRISNNKLDKKDDVKVDNKVEDVKTDKKSKGKNEELNKTIKEEKKSKVERLKKQKSKKEKTMLGYKKLNDTGYIISGVSEVFDNSENEKQLFKSKDD